MEENKKLKDKQPKKTFRLINYETKYNEEREICDLLMQSHFGKSRKELGIETSDQLKAHLKTSKSIESDHFLTQTRLQSDGQGSVVITVDDGKSPYYAAALGICDLIISGLLPESKAANKLRTLILVTLILGGQSSESHDTLLDCVSNKSQDDRQKLIAPLIRTLAVDYIQEHYHPIYQEAYEFSLQSEFYHHKHLPITEGVCQVPQDIKIKFSEYSTWREVKLWWNSSGKIDYFKRIRETDENRSLWESEIELAAVESLFKIKIRVETERNDSSFSPIGAISHVLLDDQFTVEEKEQLCVLKVCVKSSEAYYLRLKSFSKIKNSIEKIDDTMYDSARQSIDLYNKFCDMNISYKPPLKIQQLFSRDLVKQIYLFTYGFIDIKDKRLQLASPLREKVCLFMEENRDLTIKIMTDSLLPPFTADELSFLEYEGIISMGKKEKRYVLLGANDGIDEKSLATRLKGLPESTERLCKNLNIDALEFCVIYEGFRWKYYRKVKYSIKNSDNLSDHEINLDEISRRTAVALQKNKIFQAFEYCIRGIQLDEDFLNKSRELHFSATWDMFIITWDNLERENEFLKAIDEMSVDHLHIRNVNRTQVLAIYINSWPLKDFLKSNAKHIKYVKMRSVGTWGVLAFINRYDVMDLLSKRTIIMKNKNQFIEAMIIAAEYNKQESLTFLERECNIIHQVDEKGRSALYLAVAYNFKNAVRYLVQRGASINLKEELNNTPNDFQSPFVLAAEKNNFEMIQYFVQHSSDMISTKTLAKSIRVTQSLDIIRYLLSYIGEAEICHASIESSVVAKEDVNVLRFLLMYIAKSANYQSLCDKIFDKALAAGKLDIIMLCVNEFGMNPNTEINNRFPSLIYASSNGYVDVVRFLIQAGVDPNQSTDCWIDGKMYRRPIICALQDNRLPMIKCIIEESMARGILLKQDDFTQEQLELVARIQQEVEMEQRFKVSAGFVSKGPGILADGQQSRDQGHIYPHVSEIAEQGVSPQSK
jgi:ankyrin repeat protein